MTRPMISTGPPFPDHKYPNSPWCVTYKAGATGNLRVHRHYSRREDATRAWQAHQPPHAMTPAELALIVLGVAGVIFAADLIRSRRQLHDPNLERDMAFAHVLDAYYTRDGIPR